MALLVNGKKVAGLGLPGADGKSAYQTAVEGGYQGTEEEFKQLLANALDQETADGRYLQLTGGAMTGPITVNTNNNLIYLPNTKAPEAGEGSLWVGFEEDNDGAGSVVIQARLPGMYVRDIIFNHYGIDLSEGRISNLGDPFDDDDAISRSYADGRYLMLGETITANTNNDFIYLPNTKVPENGGHALRIDFEEDDDGAGSMVIYPRLPGMFESRITFNYNGIDLSCEGMPNRRIMNLGTPIDENDATPKSYVDAIKPKSVQIALPASGWSNNAQTVTVTGVLADETKQLIQPMPAIASQIAYMSAGIYCSGQAANSLTFTCSETPTEDITLYIVITEVGA